MTRAEKAEGNGHANSVRNHWLAYNTGATVLTCRTCTSRCSQGPVAVQPGNSADCTSIASRPP